MKIRKLNLLIIIGVFLLVSCNNDEETKPEFESIGLILGLDEATCACCGNWKIDIDGNQNTRQFIELPQGSEIDLENATFPISVNLNWSESDSSSCNFIIIEEIELN